MYGPAWALFSPLRSSLRFLFWAQHRIVPPKKKTGKKSQQEQRINVSCNLRPFQTFPRVDVATLNFVCQRSLIFLLHYHLFVCFGFWKFWHMTKGHSVYFSFEWHQETISKLFGVCKPHKYTFVTLEICLFLSLSMVSMYVVSMYQVVLVAEHRGPESP